MRVCVCVGWCVGGHVHAVIFGVNTSGFAVPTDPPNMHKHSSILVEHGRRLCNNVLAAGQSVLHFGTVFS